MTWILWDKNLQQNRRQQLMKIEDIGDTEKWLGGGGSLRVPR